MPHPGESGTICHVLLFHILFMDFSLIPVALAKIAIGSTPIYTNPQTPEAVVSSGGFFSNLFDGLGSLVLLVLAAYIFVKIIRLIFEIYAAKNLAYIRITLPRADSKLDKEKETKKDFKEKIGIMSIFYKGIHKISEATLWETILDIVFNHAKISLEMVYHEGQVHFYIVTYANYATLITQQVTSNYPDAEVRIVTAKEYGEIKPKGYTLRAASI